MPIEIAIRVDHYFHAEQKPPKGVTLANIADAIAALSKGQDMKHEQLVALLAAATTTQAETNAVLVKIAGETQQVLDKVAELQAAIDASDDVPQEVQDAAQALVDKVSEATSLAALVDAKVPDATTGGTGEGGTGGGTGEGEGGTQQP